LLIVEDDRALGEMLTDLFSNEGYLVDVATTASKGCTAASPAAMTP
jgi:Response regulators consisting of a CheY-like receiver domain and a winged-helix DNA-binding domain